MAIEIRKQWMNRLSSQLLTGLVLMIVVSLNSLVSGQEQQRTFVQKGKALGVHDASNHWQSRQQGLEGKGERIFLYADKMIGKGDFKVTARLRMLNQAKSAAGFVLGESFFGFEGAKGEEIFLNGPLFGGYQNIQRSATAFERGSWIDFQMQRRQDEIKFSINGKSIHTFKYDGPIGQIGFSPWRSTMQIEQFAASGTLVDRCLLYTSPSPRD